MILLNMNDTIQAVNNTLNYSDVFKNIITITGSIFGIYWVIYQIVQARKNNKEKALNNILEKKKHKEVIKPVLKFQEHYKDSGNYFDGLQNNGFIHYHIKNIGGSAILLEYNALLHNSMICNINKYLGRTLMTDEEFVLSFEPNSKSKYIADCLCHFKLTLEDNENNKYYQIAEGSYIGNITFSPPEEIL